MKFFSFEKKWVRVLRRGIAIGVLSFISVILSAYLEVAPLVVIPIVTAILAAIDRITRK